MTLERDILNTCRDISRNMSDLPKRAEVESMITSCLLTARLEAKAEVAEHQKNCMTAGHFSELMNTINEVKNIKRYRLTGKQLFMLISGLLTIAGTVFGITIQF